jgi:hypothetical protein
MSGTNEEDIKIDEDYAGVKNFSSINQNSSLWRQPLTEEGKLLTRHEDNNITLGNALFTERKDSRDENNTERVFY